MSIRRMLAPPHVVGGVAGGAIEVVAAQGAPLVVIHRNADVARQYAFAAARCLVVASVLAPILFVSAVPGSIFSHARERCIRRARRRAYRSGAVPIVMDALTRFFLQP